jgi:hypothetical protein
MELRRLIDKDASQHIELMLESSGHDRTIAYWKWLNCNLPSGDTIIYGIIENDRVIGSYAVHLVPLQYNGDVFKCGFATQAVVHSKYRNLQRIVSLSREVLDLCKELKFDFIFGFPNNNIWPVKKKIIGWKEVSKLKQLVVDISSFSSINNKNVIVLERCNDIEFLQEKGVAFIKTNEWFKWRYFDNPIAHYHVCGITCESGKKISSYIVLKTYRGNENIGHIIDIQSKNREDMEQLLSSAAEYFNWMGVKEISLWCTPSDEWYKFFVNLSVNSAYNVTDTNFGIFPLSKNGFNTDFYNIGNWNLKMFMSDAF